jgi:hypothetical protein
MSNLWEDCDIKEIDDVISSLDDLSLCGDSYQTCCYLFIYKVYDIINC